LTILVTGGAGFIGSNFVLDWFAQRDEPIVNLDKLTYAGNLANLAPLERDARHLFVRGDIADSGLVRQLLARHRPRAILSFAAESHVDRSIHGPADFIRTNVLGTFNLLEEARAHWGGLSGREREDFRFLHVSTDEVYGSLGPEDPRFSETTAYSPNSPYSASKAGFSSYLVSMGLKLRPLGIAVTNVRFGFVDTKMAKSPRKPMMMTADAAATHILRCLETRPIQLTAPKLVGFLVHLIRWAQSVRVWMT